MNDDSPDRHICGVILAGGLASRMNYLDKPLQSLANRQLIDYVIANAKPQVSQLVLSVNRNLEAYEKYGLPLVTDSDTELSGPLVGIYSAMKWYSEQKLTTDYLACFPADVPFFPSDIVAKLALSLQETVRNAQSKQPKANVIWCQTGQQVQPLFSLWSFELLLDLRDSISKGIYGPKLFFEHFPSTKLLLPAAKNELFFNVNTAEDLKLVKTFLP